MPSPFKNRVFLAFDFGTKRIGVAVGQTITMTANPLEIVLAKNGVPNWEHIETLIQEWQPSGLVVGIPYNMNGTQQPITDKARHFANTLKKKFALPIFEIDERLSTVEAKQMMFDLGGYRALKEMSVDSFAAKIILESWMLQSQEDEK